MIKKILVGLSDRPDVASLLSRTVELAREHRASVTCITVFDPDREARIGPVGVGNSHAAKRMIARRCEEVRERLQGLADQLLSACAEQGIACRLVAAEGHVVDLLTSYAKNHDLVLSSTAEEGLSARTKGARALYDLVAQAESPVIAEPRTYRPVRTVLIAYDGSDAAQRAVRSFAAHNPWPQAAIRIVHFGTEEAESERLLAEARALFDDSKAARIETEFVPGKVTQLEDYAESIQADAVVLGNKGRAAFLRTIVPDTARDLLRSSERCLFMAH